MNDPGRLIKNKITINEELDKGKKYNQISQG